MIVYLDTLALVPLLIDEPAASACGELWDLADKVVCTRLGYVESVAAVADLVAASGDRLLLAAWREEGVAVRDTAVL